MKFPKWHSLWECFPSVTVSTYWQWSKKWKLPTANKTLGGQNLSIHEMKRSFHTKYEPTEELLWHKWLIALIKMKECITTHLLLCMGLHDCRLVIVPILTTINHQKKKKKHLQWVWKYKDRDFESVKKVTQFDKVFFLLNKVNGRMHVHCYPGEAITPSCTMGKQAHQ